MRESTGDAQIERLSEFVRGLYFEIQTIEGVQPLEIWNGIRELFDPYEKTALIKNLYKIVFPLVNEQCFGWPFAEHSRLARETVAAVLDWFSSDPDTRLFERFPHPPTGDADQKELYRMVKTTAAAVVADLHPIDRGGKGEHADKQTLSQGVFPGGLFDFREMRIVDNELPFIIFTDKEYRVIHGLAIVYLWLIDLDRIFLGTLEKQNVDAAIIGEYRQFARKVQKENPLTLHGRKVEASELTALILDLLKREDYLDLFEDVYRWFEQARTKFGI
ncbi:MAG: hypothetical protein ACHQ1F_06000 [Spirochaetia bacterium]